MRAFLLTALALGGVGLLLATTSVGALTVDTSTQRLAVVEERLSVDPDVVITPQGVSTQNNDRNANADVCPGREASTNNANARGDLISGNLVYKAFVEESSVAAWPAGRIYRADVYGDGTLFSTLYFENGNANDSAVEGVKLIVDMGVTSGGPESYSTIVTRLDACP